MAGSINDVLSLASSGTAPLASTLTAQKAIGASSLSVAAATGWPTATNSLIWFKLYQATTVNTTQGTLLMPISGTETLWKGLLSGLTVNNLTLTSGTDQLYPIGSIVEPMLTSSQWDAMFNGLSLEHSQLNGTHNAAAAATIATQFANNAIATSKLALDSGIQATSLSTSAITLGYTQLTGLSSNYSGGVAQVTGFTVNVTIPTGWTRRIKITVWCGDVNMSAAGTPGLSIWDGAVSTGTRLAYTRNGTTGSYNIPLIAMASFVPTAGAKTYNVGLETSSGNAVIQATPTNPAFILVEAI